MAEHRVLVTVNAPVHQVYELFSHFNDYPKFMTYVKEVTYSDDQHSHWVVDVAGRHEWDAVNVGWVPDRRIGWRSTGGVEHSGRVTFEPVGADRTLLTVAVVYEPPAGVLGQLAEALGAGGHFEARLQHDLDHFARMVEQAPPGALDPLSSSYLFHEGSAAAQGRTTHAQDRTMGMSSDLAPDDASSTSRATADTAPNDPDIPLVPGTSREIHTL
jgi:hypothetical protein